MLDEFETQEKPKTRGRSAIAALVALAIVAGSVIGGYLAFRDSFNSLVGSVIDRFTVEDYEGPGGEPTVIVIEAGDTGEDVARKLLAADVIKSFDAIYRDMLTVDLTIYPGHYEFPTQIPGAKALEILLAGQNRVVVTTTIPEGLQVVEIVPILASDLGLAEEDLHEVIAERDAELPGPTLEGYLFPAAYTFDPGVSAEVVIDTLLLRMAAELEGYGLSIEDSLDVLTMASMIQMEGRLEPDFYKISAVFNNRLDRNIALQSDPTVKYYYEGSIDSFQQGLADTDNLYNTYVYPGLPPGPISSPGALAIDAALNPAPGDWLYFVAINLATGETVFSETLYEHEKAAELYRQWLRDNPGWDD
ncbi:MAG: endolytic transglycosylase MltG [Aquiluna sp.]